MAASVECIPLSELLLSRPALFTLVSLFAEFRLQYQPGSDPKMGRKPLPSLITLSGERNSRLRSVLLPLLLPMASFAPILNSMKPPVEPIYKAACGGDGGALKTLAELILPFKNRHAVREVVFFFLFLC